MAEINIERKDRSLLPWLLAAVLLVALVWFLFSRNANDGTADAMRSDSTYRDTSAAAGTLAPPASTPPANPAADAADSARRVRDTSGTLPPR